MSGSAQPDEEAEVVQSPALTAAPPFYTQTVKVIDEVNPLVVDVKTLPEQ